MTKRLLSAEHLQGEDAELAQLLGSAAPFAIDPFRKRRILVRIERGVSARPARFWLRSAIALSLLISGSAAAAIGHHYAPPGTGFFGLSGSPSATSTPTQHALSAGASHHDGAPVDHAPSPDSAANDATTAPEPANSASLGASSPAPATSSAPVIAARSGARTRPESSEDASSVVEAIQALRAGRDPARAQGLLDDYLKTHPHGALSGEALALSIEAASARNDPRAADYARRYLASYPRGKYRDLAKRALEKSH